MTLRFLTNFLKEQQLSLNDTFLLWSMEKTLGKVYSETNIAKTLLLLYGNKSRLSIVVIYFNS
jgi:hypothetical protein